MVATATGNFCLPPGWTGGPRNCAMGTHIRCALLALSELCKQTMHLVIRSVASHIAFAASMTMLSAESKSTFVQEIRNLPSGSEQEHI